jgi:hypothetical protein
MEFAPIEPVNLVTIQLPSCTLAISSSDNPLSFYHHGTLPSDDKVGKKPHTKVPQMRLKESDCPESGPKHPKAAADYLTRRELHILRQALKEAGVPSTFHPMKYNWTWCLDTS